MVNDFHSEKKIKKMLDNQLISPSQLHLNFVDDFETTWQITKVGSIRCDRETRPRIAKWFNTYRFMIMVVSSVDIEELDFDKIPVEQHRVKLMVYFALSYVAYLKYCQTVKRIASSKFTDVTECVEDSTD